MIGEHFHQFLARHQRFSAIEIETTAFCNRRCPFCPNSLPGRKRGIMPDEDVHAIIDQLAKLQYEGRIAFHMYGEPLLDARLTSFIKYARTHCPRAFIKINTNGDYLDRLKFTSLVDAGIDLLYVSQYDGKIQKNVADVLQWICQKQPKWRHHIQVRVLNTFSDNRAGLLKAIATLKHPLQAPCYRPATTMVINWKGEQVLCCDDYYGTSVIGSIHDHSLLSLWNSPRLRNIRTTLLAGNRRAFPLCARCSYRQFGADGDNTNEENFHKYGIFTSLFVPQDTLLDNCVATPCSRHM